MHGSLSEDQRFLRDTVAEVALDIGIGPGRSAEELDCVATWKTLVDAGFAAFALPVRVGGGGSSMLDVAVVLEVFGAALCPAPLLGSGVLAARLLAAADARADVLEPVVNGIRAAAVVLTPDLATPARPGAVGSGLAFDAHPDGGFALALDAVDGSVAVASLGPGVGIDALDVTRTIRAVSLAGFDVAGRLDPEAAQRWLAGALVAVSAETLGLMTGALDLAVSYAKERKQFDRPIGSFQAIQHLCADAHTTVEATRSAVYGAADLVDNAPVADAIHAARVAKAYASGAVRSVIETSLQVHGGIGMTWEFAGHHYLRRGLVDRAVLGDERYHRTAIAHDLLAGTVAREIGVPPPEV